MTIWSYYCEDCDFTPRIQFKDPCEARRVFQECRAELRRVLEEQEMGTPTQELASLFFVAEHPGHKVWLVSDNGVWLRVTWPEENCA